MAGEAPAGDYVPVNGWTDFEEKLQTAGSAPIYLQLQSPGPYRMVNGLRPGQGVSAIIRCEDASIDIDIKGAEEYVAEPDSTLDFWGCGIHTDRLFPLAERTQFNECQVFGECQGFVGICLRPDHGLCCVCLPECTPERFLAATDTHSQILCERQFTDPNLPGAQQMDPEGRTITWSHSTFTCGPEVVDGPNGAEATKESFLDIVKGEWPYIALAGGLVLLAMLTLIVLLVRRRRWQSKKIQAQRESSYRSGAATGPKTPPDASVPMPRHRWSETPSQGTTPVSQRGSMPRASVSQISFVEESGTRGVPSGSAANPMSPAALSEGPPGTPGTPQGTSVSSFNSDLPTAIQHTMAQFKRDLPDVPLDILQHIGSGGYGNVYRGSWKGLEVAIKTIVFQDRLEDGTAERVIKEAAIACNMSNEHVVNTFAHELKRMPVQVPGELVDYKLYIIQEFCVGGSLAKLLTGEHLMTSVGGVQVHRVLTVLRHVASGMAYMHKLRMVHGDLNPSNIFLQLSDNKYVQTPRRRKKAWRPLTKDAARGLDDGNCIVKLGDFGLTVQLQHGCTHVSNITHGTPFYSAPELATQGRLQCESDVYAFGVLMWEMYHNDTPYDMQDDNYIPNPQFGRFSPTAPLNYALLAISCLSAQPEDRPSFVQVIEFLAAIGLELASGYYTNMNGVTEPTSVIAQKPISEMMDSADVPRNLLPIPHSRTNSRTNSSSMQALQRKVLSQGSPANGAGGGSNPRVNSHSLKGLHSHSVRTRSLSRSDGRNSGRGSAKKGSKGSPRPLGEHGEAHGVQMQIVEDDMQIDSEVTLSLQCSTPNGPESARGV